MIFFFLENISWNFNSPISGVWNENQRFFLTTNTFNTFPHDLMEILHSLHTIPFRYRYRWIPLKCSDITFCFSLDWIDLNCLQVACLRACMPVVDLIRLFVREIRLHFPTWGVMGLIYVHSDDWALTPIVQFSICNWFRQHQDCPLSELINTFDDAL